MSKSKKLNSLVVNFQKNSDSKTFNEIYEIVSKDWNLPSVSKVTGVGKDDLYSHYNETLLTTINDFKIEIGNFENVLRFNLKRVRCKLMDKQKRYSKRFILDRPEKEDKPLFMETIESESSVELEVIEKVQKETEQRQLLGTLRANVGDFEKTVIDICLDNTIDISKPNGELNILKVAKLLGTNSNKVTRALNKIKLSYNADIFGDIQDYICA